jgi:hypothetical protein
MGYLRIGEPYRNARGVATHDYICRAPGGDSAPESGPSLPTFDSGLATRNESRMARPLLLPDLRRNRMKFAGLYLLGYVILIAGIVAALWKTGVLQSVGAGWTAIGIVIAIGLGIMIAVANSGRKENISIEK